MRSVYLVPSSRKPQTRDSILQVSSLVERKVTDMVDINVKGHDKSSRIARNYRFRVKLIPRICLLCL